jgi:hypothetical protein
MGAKCVIMAQKTVIMKTKSVFMEELCEFHGENMEDSMKKIPNYSRFK